MGVERVTAVRAGRGRIGQLHRGHRQYMSSPQSPHVPSAFMRSDGCGQGGLDRRSISASASASAILMTPPVPAAQHRGRPRTGARSAPWRQLAALRDLRSWHAGPHSRLRGRRASGPRDPASPAASTPPSLPGMDAGPRPPAERSPGSGCGLPAARREGPARCAGGCACRSSRHDGCRGRRGCREPSHGHDSDPGRAVRYRRIPRTRNPEVPAWLPCTGLAPRDPP